MGGSHAVGRQRNDDEGDCSIADTSVPTSGTADRVLDEAGTADDNGAAAAAVVFSFEIRTWDLPIGMFNETLTQYTTAIT